MSAPSFAELAKAASDYGIAAAHRGYMTGAGDDPGFLKALHAEREAHQMLLDLFAVLVPEREPLSAADRAGLFEAAARIEDVVRDVRSVLGAVS